jgi:hypothetical protein
MRELHGRRFAPLQDFRAFRLIVKSPVIDSMTQDFDIAPGTVNNIVPRSNAGAAGPFP